MNQHLSVAAVALVVGALAGFGGQRLSPPREKIVEKPVHVTVAASKHAWPDLNEAETIALGEKLASLKGATVTIMCNDAACDDLAHDLDNAMEIADAKSSLDRSVMPLGYGIGVITKDVATSQQVAGAIKAVTAGRLDVGSYTQDNLNGAILIVIGKRPR